MTAARLLVRALADPDGLGAVDWNALIASARAEQLIGSLAFRLEGKAVPAKVESILAAARADARVVRTQALWEAEMARRALAPLGIPVVLLKGNAFHAAGLDASVGRSVGDLDILVPKASLEAAETALLAAGWERVKEADGYDDLYYRRWMHELPPLIHHTRDRMIDVHHNILPSTARPKPHAAALIGDSILPGTGRGTARSAVEGSHASAGTETGPLHHPAAPAGPPPRTGEELRILSPPDMIVHAAAHLFADGDLAGGLRNLWDIDRLLREFAADPGFWPSLAARARRHQLVRPVARALRLSARLYDTPVDRAVAGRDRLSDRLFAARLLARNGWGQPVRPLLRLAFYIRSHWLRMPPLMLARHLWIKART